MNDKLLVANHDSHPKRVIGVTIVTYCPVHYTVNIDLRLVSHFDLFIGTKI